MSEMKSCIYSILNVYRCNWIYQVQHVLKSIFNIFIILSGCTKGFVRVRTVEPFDIAHCTIPPLNTDYGVTLDTCKATAAQTGSTAFNYGNSDNSCHTKSCQNGDLTIGIYTGGSGPYWIYTNFYSC